MIDGTSITLCNVDACARIPGVVACPCTIVLGTLGAVAHLFLKGVMDSGYLQYFIIDSIDRISTHMYDEAFVHWARRLLKTCPSVLAIAHDWSPAAQLFCDYLDRPVVWSLLEDEACGDKESTTGAPDHGKRE